MGAGLCGQGGVNAALVGILASAALSGSVAAPAALAAAGKVRPSPAAYERDYRQCIENIRVFDYPTAEYPASEYESLEKNVVTVTGEGALLWNGEPIDLVRLNQYLDVAQTLDPEPLYMVLTDGDAPPELVRDVHMVFVVSHVCPGQRAD
jgi:hypothetical protein